MDMENTAISGNIENESPSHIMNGNGMQQDHRDVINVFENVKIVDGDHANDNDNTNANASTNAIAAEYSVDLSYDNASRSQASSVTATSVKVSKAAASIPIPPQIIAVEDGVNHTAATENSNEKTAPIGNVFDDVADDAYLPPATTKSNGIGVFDNIPDDAYEKTHMDLVTTAFDDIEDTNGDVYGKEDTDPESTVAAEVLEDIPREVEDAPAEEEKVVLDHDHSTSIPTHDSQDSVFQNVPEDIYDEVQRLDPFDNVPENAYSGSGDHDDEKEKEPSIVNAFEDVPDVAYEETPVTPDALVSTVKIEDDKNVSENEIQNDLDVGGNDVMYHLESTTDTSHTGEHVDESKQTNGDVIENKDNTNDNFGEFDDVAMASIAVTATDSQAENESLPRKNLEEAKNFDENVVGVEVDGSPQSDGLIQSIDTQEKD